MKKGMSLIVLVITIIVMIVLAGVVVIGLSNNNPIAKANEASFKSGAKSYATELVTKITTDYALDPTSVIANDLEVKSEDLKNYISSISSNDQSKYEIQNGELAYIGNSKEEGAWINQIGVLNATPFKIIDKNIPPYNYYHTNSYKIGEYLYSVSSDSSSNIILTKYRISDGTTVVSEKNLNIKGRVFSLIGLGNGKIAISGYIKLSSTSTAGFLAVLDENLNIIESKEFRTYSYMHTNIVSLSNGNIGAVIANTYLNSSGYLTNLVYTYNVYDENLNIVDNIENIPITNGSTVYLYDNIIKVGKYIDIYGYTSTNKRMYHITIDEKGKFVKDYTDTINNSQAVHVTTDNTYVYGIKYTYTSSNFMNIYSSTSYLYKLNPVTGEYTDVVFPEPSLTKITFGYKGDLLVILSSTAIINSVNSSVPKVYRYSSNLELRCISKPTEIPNFLLHSIFTLDKNKYLGVGYEYINNAWHTAFVTLEPSSN